MASKLKSFLDAILSSNKIEFICILLIAFFSFVGSVILTNPSLAETYADGLKVGGKGGLPVKSNNYQTSLGTLRMGFYLLPGNRIEVDSSGSQKIVFGLISIAADEAMEIGKENVDVKISNYKIKLSQKNGVVSPYITFVQDQKSGEWLATDGCMIFDPCLKIIDNSIVKLIGGPIKISGKSFADATIEIKNGHPINMDSDPQQTSTFEKSGAGDPIYQVQRKLLNLGYNPGPSDGILGALTRDALRKYQSAHGLQSTGKPDDQTLRTLDLEVQQLKTSSPPNKSPSKEEDETRALPLLPPYEVSLKGGNEVRVSNPNDFSVVSGVRNGKAGMNLHVPANGTASVFVPDGKYDIFFVYSNKPDALFQGDSFTLNDNGVEIRIVKVVGGNYGIRQVK